MLTIVTSEKEYFDEENGLFVKIDSQKINLEHSLSSIYEWESKWKKPFITRSENEDDKTNEQVRDYIKCMVLNREEVNLSCIDYLSMKEIEEIKKYIIDPMTATTFRKRKENDNGIITSEIIYYWMVSMNIPFECQYWHLNKLLTLIKVISNKNNPEKMSKHDIYEQNRRLNEERRKKYNTKG